MPTTTKKASGKKTASKKQASGKGKSGQTNGFMKPVQPDEQLAAIVGNEPRPRTELTKKLWEYVKSHDLQDAEDRRMINADEKLQPVVGGKKRVSMFEMTRFMNQHLERDK